MTDELTTNLKAVRDGSEKAKKTLTPEQVKEHEKNLIRGLFEVYPELVAVGCDILNEKFRIQVVIAEAADPTPFKVKAVRPDLLRLAVEEKGADAMNDLLHRIEMNDREVLRRVKALRAERDALKAERDAARAELAALKPEGAAPRADQ